jgi:hypothetical protein
MILLRAGLRRVVIAFVLSAACALPTHAATPCIDTNSQSFLVRRTMAVRQPGGDDIAVTGTVASLNPATGEVGIKAFGIDGEQQIKPGTIKLATQEPSMAAQMALPVKTPLGLLSAEFPLADITVEHGIIRYPDCIMAESGHDTAFTGTLTFEGEKLKVEGAFFHYAPPIGGGGPGIVGGKPG